MYIFLVLKESEGEKSDADADPDLVVDVANEVCIKIKSSYCVDGLDLSSIYLYGVLVVLFDSI